MEIEALISYSFSFERRGTGVLLSKRNLNRGLTRGAEDWGGLLGREVNYLAHLHF
jgi:hypothetical protein